MKWVKPKTGDIRIRSFFAWLPVCASETNEVRWLECVTVLFRYQPTMYGHYWSSVRFLDNKSEVKQ